MVMGWRLNCPCQGLSRLCSKRHGTKQNKNTSQRLHSPQWRLGSCMQLNQVPVCFVVLSSLTYSEPSPRHSSYPWLAIRDSWCFRASSESREKMTGVIWWLGLILQPWVADAGGPVVQLTATLASVSEESYRCSSWWKDSPHRQGRD